MAELVAKGERPVRLVYQDGAQHPAFRHRIAEVSRPDALMPPVELALDDPNARYNAKARSASTATALVLAQAQLRAQPPQAQAVAPQPAAPGEKFAAAALGAFHHDDAKPEIAPLATEGANSVGAATTGTASIAPKPVSSAWSPSRDQNRSRKDHCRQVERRQVEHRKDQRKDQRRKNQRDQDKRDEDRNGQTAGGESGQAENRRSLNAALTSSAAPKRRGARSKISRCRLARPAH